MGYRYNSPPGWPPPPEGWTPPPGWQPDPSWPPAPEGWQFWVDDGAGQSGAAAGSGETGAGTVGPSPAAGDTSADAAGAAQSGGGQSGGGHGGEDATQVLGTPTQSFGATSAPQGGAAQPSGAGAGYQYGASGPLENPADSPYDTGELRSGAQQQGAAGGYPAQGAVPPGSHPAQAHDQGGYPQQQGGYLQQQGGYAPGQGGYPQQAGYPQTQGGYPGAPGGYPAQGGPDSSGKKNTGLIVAIVAAIALVIGLLVWGGIALFGGSDDPDPVPTVPAPTAPPTSEPTEEPTEEPTPEPTEEPTEEPTTEPTDDTGGSTGGSEEAIILSLGEEAVIEGTESDPEVTLAVTGVEPWEDSDSLFCSEPELDGYIAIAVEVTTGDSAYDFNVLNLSVADADGQSIIDEVNPFTGLLCENPDALPTELAADETHTGTIIFDVPEDASYVVWEDWLDFTGEGQTYLWEY